MLLSIAQYFDAMDLLEVGLKLYPENAAFSEMKGSCHFQLQVCVNSYKLENNLTVSVAN